MAEEKCPGDVGTAVKLFNDSFGKDLESRLRAVNVLAKIVGWAINDAKMLDRVLSPIRTYMEWLAAGERMWLPRRDDSPRAMEASGALDARGGGVYVCMCAVRRMSARWTAHRTRGLSCPLVSPTSAPPSLVPPPPSCPCVSCSPRSPLLAVRLLAASSSPLTSRNPCLNTLATRSLLEPPPAPLPRHLHLATRSHSFATLSLSSLHTSIHHNAPPTFQTTSARCCC